MNDLTPTAAGALTAADSSAQWDMAAARFLATRKSEKTRLTYANALKQYRAACMVGNLPPISGDALIAYSTHLEAQRGELAADTIRLRLKAVTSFFGWLYTFGLSPIKPELVSKLITMPEARRLSPRDLLSEDEAQRLLAAARFWPADHCLIALMLGAGLRLSEALALKASDVYQAGGRCFVRVQSGKGGKSREVPISPATFETVNVYIGNFDNIQVSIFPDHYPRRVQRIITRQAKRAGISKPITPHSLRHTYANKLAELGTPIELIGELLGHASLDTTKTYTRPGELLRRADLPALPW